MGANDTKSKRVTISDLVTHLGLTKGTVSRALRGYPDISEDTRRRVAAAAKAMGYRPSSYASSLKTGRIQALGLVLNVDADDAHRPYLSDFLDGLSRRIGEAGWTLTVATAMSAKKVVDMHRRLVAERKVDGFIVPRTRLKDPRVELLQEAAVPFVLLGRTETDAPCAWFDIAGERAIANAVARLTRFGHTRIAYIGGSTEMTLQKMRLAGYRDGLRAAHIQFDPDLCLANAMIEERGYEAALTLLSLPTPPTAMIFALDRAALGAYKAIKGFGLKIGTDISVIGYDGIPEGAYASPTLTTFSVDLRHAGERLADMFLRRIDGTPPDSLQELEDATLIARRSDGVPRMTSEQIAAHVANLQPKKHRRER